MIVKKMVSKYQCPNVFYFAFKTYFNLPCTWTIFIYYIKFNIFLVNNNLNNNIKIII